MIFYFIMYNYRYNTVFKENLVVNMINKEFENKNDFREIKPSDIKNKENKKINIKDDKDFSKEILKYSKNKSTISKNLKSKKISISPKTQTNQIENIEKVKEKVVSLSELKKQREQSPLTTEAIKKQAELHHAIRESKSWASKQEFIHPEGKSTNQVYKLKSSDQPNPHPSFTSNKIASFLKTGKKDETATGTMEKMMWDLAVLMGMEENFVATGITEITPGSNLKNDNENLLLEKVTPTNIKGGIQVAQKGMTFASYLKQMESTSNKEINLPTISEQELAKGIAISIVFGMFDAHSENMFVDDSGKIKFFDNTRSLPNSNGFINRGTGLVSSYRCSLLCHPGARLPLSKKTIKLLKADLAKYKQKIIQLRNYLDHSKQGKSSLSALPKEWLDKEKAISAMEERIALMEKALASSTVNTLQKVAEASLPNYKFAFALCYLRTLHDKKALVDQSAEKIQMSLHTSVGQSYVDTDMSILMQLGYDLKMIKELCDQTLLSLGEIIEKLKTHYQEVFKSSPNQNVNIEKIKQSKELLESMRKNAEVDFKDITQGKIKQLIKSENEKKFINAGFEFGPSDKISKVVTYAIKLKKDFILSSNDKGYTLIYKTPTGYRTKQIGFSGKFGHVVYNNQEVGIDTLITALKNNTTPLKLEDIPKLSQTMLKKELVQGTIQIRKSPKSNDKNLYVFVQGQEELVYTPLDEGKFSRNNNIYTLENIQNFHIQK